MGTSKSTTTRRGGRPPKADTDRRSVSATVWLTPADAQLIRGAAGDRRESLSAFLVAGGLARAGQPIEEKRGAAAAELRRLLAPIGSNINQAVRAINGAQQRADDPGVVAVLEAHRQTFGEDPCYHLIGAFHKTEFSVADVPPAEGRHHPRPHEDAL